MRGKREKVLEREKRYEEKINEKRAKFKRKSDLQKLELIARCDMWRELQLAPNLTHI